MANEVLNAVVDKLELLLEGREGGQARVANGHFQQLTGSRRGAWKDMPATIFHSSSSSSFPSTPLFLLNGPHLTTTASFSSKWLCRLREREAIPSPKYPGARDSFSARNTQRCVILSVAGITRISAHHNYVLEYNNYY